MPARPAVFPRTGYYHFLGKGDMHPGQVLGTWPLARWDEWFAELKEAGRDRLWFLVNGHTLAYPSVGFPGLIDPDARSAREPGFIRALVDSARQRGFKTYAVFTTDGHALEFGKANPGLLARDRDGKPVSEDFLCLEEPRVRDYIERQYAEVLELCPVWDGVVFHPTESSPMRFNPATAAEYKRETGGNLLARPDAALIPWFNELYARFIARSVEWWCSRLPRLDPVMFNCWWTNGAPDVYRGILSRETRVCVWDYDYRAVGWRSRPVARWTESFGPERIIFMPSSGGYPDGRPPIDEAAMGYDRLLALASFLGVREVVFFAGWGAGENAEIRLDRALLAAAPAQPDAALLDALDADYESARGRVVRTAGAR